MILAVPTSARAQATPAGAAGTAAAKAPQAAALAVVRPPDLDSVVEDAKSRQKALYKSRALLLYASHVGDVGLQIYRYPARYGLDGRSFKGLAADANVRFDGFNPRGPRGFELTGLEAVFDLPLGVHHRLGIAGAITSLGAEFFPSDTPAGSAGNRPELVFRAGRLRAFYRFEHAAFAAEVGVKVPLFWMVQNGKPSPDAAAPGPDLYGGSIPLMIYGGVGL